MKTWEINPNTECREFSGCIFHSKKDLQLKSYNGRGYTDKWLNKYLWKLPLKVITYIYYVSRLLRVYKKNRVPIAWQKVSWRCPICYRNVKEINFITIRIPCIKYFVWRTASPTTFLPSYFYINIHKTS